MRWRRWRPLASTLRRKPSSTLLDAAGEAPLEHLREADDGVERRAQLVAHVGEELALEAVGLADARVGAVERVRVLLERARVAAQVVGALVDLRFEQLRARLDALRAPAVRDAEQQQRGDERRGGEERRLPVRGLDRHAQRRRRSPRAAGRRGPHLESVLAGIEVGVLLERGAVDRQPVGIEADELHLVAQLVRRAVGEAAEVEAHVVPAALDGERRRGVEPLLAGAQSRRHRERRAQDERPPRAERHALDARLRRRERRLLERRVVARDAAREAGPHASLLVEGERVAGRGVVADQARAAVEAAQDRAAAAVGARVEVIDAGGGGQPEAAARVFADGEDGAGVDATVAAEAAERERRCRACERIGGWTEAQQTAAGGADPHFAIAGGEEAIQAAIGNPLRGGPRAHSRPSGFGVVTERGEAAAARHPDSAVPILGDRHHLLRRQAVGDVQGQHLGRARAPIVEAQPAGAAEQTHPEVAVLRLEEVEHVAAGEPLFLAVDGAAAARGVEEAEPARRAHPQPAATIAQHVPHLARG